MSFAFGSTLGTSFGVLSTFRFAFSFALALALADALAFVPLSRRSSGLLVF